VAGQMVAAGPTVKEAPAQMAANDNAAVGPTKMPQAGASAASNPLAAFLLLGAVFSAGMFWKSKVIG